MQVLGVMLGGALGAVARYLTTLWVQGALRGSMASFPLATMTVNVVGCFLLALVTEIGLRGMVSPALRLAIGTGFLGALTTFSTFELEAHALLEGGQATRAAIYLLGNLIVGYVAILLGRALALRLAGVA